MVTVAVLRAAPPPPGAVQVQGGSIAANFVKGATSRKKGAKKGHFSGRKRGKKGQKKGVPVFSDTVDEFSRCFRPTSAGLPVFSDAV